MVLIEIINYIALHLNKLPRHHYLLVELKTKHILRLK